METAVALPTLTPLHISFGCGEKACRVGRFETECVRRGCCLSASVVGTKLDNITDGENVPDSISLSPSPSVPSHRLH